MQMMALMANQLNSGKALLAEGQSGKNALNGSFGNAMSKVIAENEEGSGNTLAGKLTASAQQLIQSGNASEKEELLKQLKQLLQEMDGNIKKILEEALSLKKNSELSAELDSLTEDNTFKKLLKDITAEGLSILNDLFGSGENAKEIYRNDQALISLDKSLKNLDLQSENAEEEQWNKIKNVISNIVDISSSEEKSMVTLFAAGTPVLDKLTSQQLNGGQSITSDSMAKATEAFQRFQNMIQSVVKGEQPVNDLTSSQLKKIKEAVLTYSKAFEGKERTFDLKSLSGTKEEKALFQALLSNVNRKQQLPSAYAQQITGKDMAKWMSQASSEMKKTNVEMSAKFSDQQTTINHQAPMTKVEQLVIRVDQQSQTPAQKQVFQQMQDMIQSSKMFMDKSGNQEMQIKLKPSSLGEMTIKFAQINGEMAVKIMVTSQAAKEMLEGNMQQLRHMFSPQQVVVEKTEQTLNQQFLNEEEAESFHDKEDQSSEQNFDEDFEEEESAEAAVSFSDILNEKV